MSDPPVAPRWFFAECRTAACRFRFPVDSTQRPGLHCPRCGGELVYSTTIPTGEALTRPSAAQASLKGLLDSIRSIHNTGSMFRTADGAGLDHLYLCGITSTPDHPRLAKAALGAQATVPWTYHPNAADLATSLVNDGYRLWALERLTGDQAPTLPPPLPAGSRVVLVVGNEKAGVDPAVLDRCERVLALPMLGAKGTLNAAVAFGIAAYALRFGRPSPLDTFADSA